MQTTFSPQLIARAQEIFERRSGRAVSVEETERYLETLARLGDLVVRVMRQEASRADGGAKKKANGPQNAQGP